MCEQCLPATASEPSGYSRRSIFQAVGAGSVLLAGRRLNGGRSPDRRSRPAVASEVAPGLEILPRTAWAGNGNLPVRAMPPEEVRFMLVHHTASSNNYQPDGVASILLGAYRFHVSAEKGFADISYNFLIDRFGRVWEGRAGSVDGPVTVDATGGSQGFAQLVCLIGDFTSELPTPEAFDALTRTLAWMADRYGVDTTPGATVEFVSRGSNRWSAGENVVGSTISGHRDMSATACPGDLFYPTVHNDIQQIVTTFRGTNVPAVTAPVPVTTAGPLPQPPSTVPPTVATPTVAPSTVAPTTPPTTVAATSTTAASAAASTTTMAPLVTTAATDPSSTLPLPPITAAITTGTARAGASDDGGSVVGWVAGAVGVVAVTGAVAARRHAGHRPERSKSAESADHSPVPPAGPPTGA